MKLVDILARELKIWPEGVDAIEQSDVDSTLFEYGRGIVGSVKAHAEDSRTAHVTRAQWQAAVDTLLVWNGEGLPPVGTVCEYQCGYIEQPHQHAECKVIAHFVGESGSTLAAFTYTAHDGVIQLGRGAQNMFRTIRTAEQIAADERTNNAIAMCQATQGARDWMEAFRMLHDAGYRKFEIVDN
jgi:hypothetical protein